MRAAILQAPRTVSVEDVADPAIEQPTDAVVEVTATCICGSDLWPYRGIDRPRPGQRLGHEFVGHVREVGADVRTVHIGQFVISPFSWSDGTCPACIDGVTTGCDNRGFWAQPGSDGGQGQIIRVPFADGTLLGLPDEPDEALIPALLTLSDVMATGHHAAVCAGVQPGSTVAVVGDGAVGLCAVLAARRLGAERIIALSRHESRQAVARSFGATDIVPDRGRAAAEAVRALTGGRGAPHVLECVGLEESMVTAVQSARRGGSVGFVGAPHLETPKTIRFMFDRAVGVRGSGAFVRTYLPELARDVLAGTLDPSPVFDLELSLDDVAEGYAAMDERRAIKVLLRP